MNEEAGHHASADDQDRDDEAGETTQARVLERLRQEVRTSRLVVVDEHAQERLVAELVDNVMELRLTLPGSAAGYRTSLLVFATPARPDWSAGLGVQLWANGTVVRELTYWADEAEPDN